MTALTLVVFLAAGCSSGDRPQDQLFDDARGLASALLEAVTTGRDSAAGFGDPGEAARAITLASSASGRLASTAAEVGSITERNLGIEMAIVADQVVGLLASGDVQAAERSRVRNFVPVAAELFSMRAPSPAAARQSSPLTGPNVAIAVAILVVVGVAVSLSRGAMHARSSRRAGTHHRGSRPPEHDRRLGRTWDAPHPPHPAGSAPVASIEGDTYRTTKIRTLEVEMHELMTSTLEQVRDRGWDVSLVCPIVYVSGDPIRIQRAVLSVLGNAYLGGAERVGIVVDETASGVLLSIGHDAPFDQPDAEDVTERLVGQLGQATGNDDLEWSLARDDDVSLVTVSLGPALTARETAESGV